MSENEGKKTVTERQGSEAAERAVPNREAPKTEVERSAPARSTQTDTKPDDGWKIGNRERYTAPQVDAKPDDGPVTISGSRDVAVEVDEARTARPEGTRGAQAPEGDKRPKLSKAAAKKAVQEGGRAAIPNDPMASAADRQPQPPGGVTEQGQVNADGEPDTEDKAAERLAFHGVKGK